MAKNMRVHELAKELGMTNAEAMDLASVLGVPVKSHSSSLNEAYSDMMRRRAVRDGLTRDEQPDEPGKPVKKAPAKKSAASKADDTEPATEPATEQVDVAEPAPARRGRRRAGASGRDAGASGRADARGRDGSGAGGR